MELHTKWLESFLYFSTFLVFGMTTGMAGPALMDLLLLYFPDFDVINALAWVLFSQALMRFVGAIFAGVASDRLECNYNAILAFSMGSNAVLQVAIPLSRELWSLIMLTAISGFFAGVMDTISNIALIRVHGIKVAPYLQCLYFSYGFGAFMSPLIAKPFLSNKAGYKELTSKSLIQMDYRTINGSSIIVHEALDKAPFLDPTFWSNNPGNIAVAFWIVATLHVPVICGLTVVGLIGKSHYIEEHKRKDKAISTMNQFDDEDEEEQESFEGSLAEREKSPKEERVAVLITTLTSIVVFIFDGLQGSFGGYIFTYAKAINMSSSQAAILTSLFWGFLAIGRLLSIPLAIYFLPSSMLKISLTFSLLTTALMTLFHSTSLAIWLGTCLFALSMSNIFPSSLAMIEQHFPVTGAIACAFVVSAAIGETIVPLIVGELFDHLGTIMFMGAAAVLCSLACVTFVILRIITAKGLGKSRSVAKIEGLEN